MSGTKPPRGVDCHAHVFSADAPAVANARYRPAYAATLAAWMAAWRVGGITHGVLVQPSFFGTDNREMLAALRSEPGKLRGVAAVDPGVSDAELEAFGEAGVRAIRLNLSGVADYGALSRAPWTALFGRIAARGWHVETFVDAGEAPRLAAALAATSVPLVFDHFANPGTEPARAEATFAALARMSRERETWIKLSGPYRLGGADAAALAQRWIETLGVERLVWGSDWPWTRHEEGRAYVSLREELDRWVGNQRGPAVLWDNPCRLYRFS
ncbi:MAG TPA: amidohydrolase family protein [Usitatibacter sp.]|nr:amidohydrolase family protein [Usitatibacter sp.]